MIAYLVCPILLLLIYQDFTKFSVSGIALLGLIALQPVVALFTLDLETWLIYLVTNVVLSVAQFSILRLYFSLKERGKKEKKQFLNGIIGTGDLIFWLFLCEAFSPFNLTVFVIVSLILTLIVHVLRKQMSHKIPLIGYLSIAYLIVLISGYSCYDDTLLINMFSVE